MHTLTVKLKQHTPLIHFQHDQEGATLRASEVKPKLDKFILNQLTPEEKAQGEREGWIKSKNERIWLDYKMKIESLDVRIWDMSRDTGRTNSKTNKQIFEQMPMFFGNMHSSNDMNFVPKKMVFTPSPITLSFLSTDKEIIDVINKHISNFFLLNNFGTRQSKGFGSFYPEGILYQSNSVNNFARFKWRIGDCEVPNLDAFYNLFFAIDMFYKTLRSGINQNGVYFKSLMYHYATDQGSYWDKRTIRYEFEHFTPNKFNDKGEIKDKKDDGDNKKSEARLYRDMLGLSSTQTWKSYDDEITKDHVADNDNNKIDRFKSPLLFKPIFTKGEYVVYIIPSEIPAQYKEAKFRISSKKERKSFEMETPSDFDTVDFLSYITDEGIKKWVISILTGILNNASNGKSKLIAKSLLAIYKNIEFV